MKKVLVVHNSAAFRGVLRCKLNSAGFDCIEASDVLAGLQRAVEDRPHAVIIDAELQGLDAGGMRSVLASDPATEHLPVLLCKADSVLFRPEAETRKQREAALLLWSESREIELRFSTVQA